MKMFHKLVRNNRKKGNEAVVELDVNGEKYSGSDNIIHGFRQLATFNPETRLDEQYHNIVEDDINTINYLVQHKDIKNVSMDEINKATQSLNIKGKSADYHGLTIEHIIYAGKEIQQLLAMLMGEIFERGGIPESLKMGLLTPIFKNKGTKQQAVNYRGITVLPVIGKIIETIIKNRTQRYVLETQNKRQRGFIAGSSPMNSALPIEEAYRDSKDNNTTLQLVLLDAKAAFDTVIHSHLLRKVYLAGIDDKHWTLIKDLHENAQNSIKWEGNISTPFVVKQGIRPEAF